MLKIAIVATLCMITTRSFGESIAIKVPDEIQKYGITLLPADAPIASVYVDKIVGKDRERINSLLHYSVVLVNNGTDLIIAANVGFRYSDYEGNPHDSTFAHGYFNVGYPSQIAPGQARLFVLQRGLNIYFAKRAVRESDVDSTLLLKSGGLIADVYKIVSNAKDLSGFIDSIVLEGIGLIGPDTRDMKNHGWNRTTTY